MIEQMAQLAKKPRLSKDSSSACSKVACPYGKKCYRKNDKHLKTFYHPAIETDAECVPISHDSKELHETLPACPYGENCYRKNLVHFAEFSHPTRTSEKEETIENDISEDEQTKGGNSDDTDVYDSDDESNSNKQSSSKQRLGPSLSLLKSYTLMSDAERKALIAQAFEAKKQLEVELQAAKQEANTKAQQLLQLKQQVSSDRLYTAGELEALSRDETSYFPLIAERHYDEGSADQLHFRLAESQFYRLLSANYGSSYRVTKVEYVVNPKLVKLFKQARQTLLDTRGEELSYPVLAFHGTKEENIVSICENGFYTPGDGDFHHTTDTGWYGRGVYFSEYPGYAMSYISGSQRLLLCQILPGKIYQCRHVVHTAHLQQGYDSHSSPDGKEIVIFNNTHILPAYIVHYKSSNLDFTYQCAKNIGPKHKTSSYSSVQGLHPSRVFIGQTIGYCGEFSVDTHRLHHLTMKHAANPTTHLDYFHFLVCSTEEYKNKSSKVNKAIRWGVPIVREQFIYDSINSKELMAFTHYELTAA